MPPDHRLERFYTAMRTGVDLGVAREYAGITEETLAAWFDDDDFVDELRRIRAEQQMIAAGTVRAAVRDNPVLARQLELEARAEAEIQHLKDVAGGW